MISRIRKITAAAIAAGAMGFGSAQAGIIVNNWTLDLSGVDGLAAGTVVNGIGQIQFTGIANASQFVNDGVVNVGDIGRTQGLLTTTSFLTPTGSTILANGGLNTLGGYEMTFTFDVRNLTTLVSGPNSNFTHLGGAGGGSTGLLNIYIDNFANGGVQSNQASGLGYTDGVLIATFMIDPGLGGVFNSLTFNGSDDAQFHWVSGLANVIREGPGGTDLGNSTLLAVTASQFDADANNDGFPELVCPANIGGGGAFSPTNFCAQEDGRASLQRAVPEPTSLALMGLGLAVLGFGTKRRRNSKVA